MPTALFINGIYEGVCTEILAAQAAQPGLESFLQPYKGKVVKMLKQNAPSREQPVKLYLSTTGNLSQICYAAEIIRWEDKREMDALRREEVRQHLERYQPKEVDLFMGRESTGANAVNLLTIRLMSQLDTLHSTSLLRKVSDGLPLMRRTRSGGWSEVYELTESIHLPVETQERLQSDLAAEIQQSESLNDEALQARLATAARLPQRVQVISVGYRRNPDVIVAVLRRARGVCERCAEPAPFVRRSDGSPYLEVHHWVSLSAGGEDTIQNAAALCPNCHRELHHGTTDSR